MKNRTKIFQEMSDHPWYGRLIKGMEPKDRESIFSFIQLNECNSNAEFEYAVNRLFMDADRKPKKWALIQELLIAVNSKTEEKE